MPERGMPEVVSQTDGLDQIRVDIEICFTKQRTCPSKALTDGPTYLRHLNRVGQSRSIEVVFAGFEYLSFGLQSPKSIAVNYPVSITFELGTLTIRFALLELRMNLLIERHVKGIGVHLGLFWQSSALRPSSRVNR